MYFDESCHHGWRQGKYLTILVFQISRNLGNLYLLFSKTNFTCPLSCVNRFFSRFYQPQINIFITILYYKNILYMYFVSQDQYEFLYNAVQEYLESFDLFSNDNQSFDNDEEEDEEEDE